MTDEAVAKLRDYSWPGNVRELENIIERAMILVRGGDLTAAHLDFGRRAQAGQVSASTSVAAAASPVGSDDGSKSLGERLLDSERKEIMQAIDKSNGNIASAARTLGINRSTLYYRLRKHGLMHLLPTTKPVGEEAAETPPPGEA